VKLALDENLPPALAHALHALLAPERGEAVHIRERFGPGVADSDWIAALHGEGAWGVLTLDRKLRTRPHEQRALMQSGLVVFILAHGWAAEPYWPKAAGVIRWVPRMIDALREARPPALFEVPHRWTPHGLRPLQ
jgi:PIN like domain